MGVKLKELKIYWKKKKLVLLINALKKLKKKMYQFVQ